MKYLPRFKYNDFYMNKICIFKKKKNKKKYNDYGIDEPDGLKRLLPSLDKKKTKKKNFKKAKKKTS